MSGNNNSIYVGVDVGASRTKVAILNSDKQLIGHSIRKSGTDFTQTADICLASALEMAGSSADAIVHTISTGYGRKNVSFSNGAKTEIGCHAKGAFHYFPYAITVLDIG